MFEWEEGRQGGTYEKMRLFVSERFKIDAWLLRYEEGSYIKSHIDPVKEGRHFRLNLFIKNARRGGHFRCAQVIKRNRWFVLFRPDLYTHSVTEVHDGTRYVLSFGIVLKDKHENNYCGQPVCN